MVPVLQPIFVTEAMIVQPAQGPRWVKLRRTQCEQMTSGLLPALMAAFPTMCRILRSSVTIAAGLYSAMRDAKSA